MDNQTLLEILRAFKALFDNLPRELPDEEYTPATEQLHESYSAILHSVLSTQHFALCDDPDGECVSIFATEAERDSFIEAMCQIKEECKERGDADEIICKPITFDEFLEFADAEAFKLDNYSLDEDGAIEFVRISNSVETT